MKKFKDEEMPMMTDLELSSFVGGMLRDEGFTFNKFKNWLTSIFGQFSYVWEKSTRKRGYK